MFLLGFLLLLLASCTTLPTAGEANDAVLVLRQYESWAWALGIVLIWADVVLPVPQTAVIAALGIIYGTALGGLLGSIGLITGGLLGYGLMLTSARRVVLRFTDGESLKKVEFLFDRGGAWAIILSRSLPHSGAEIVVFLAGLARMPMNKFIAALTIGSVPTAFVFAAIGAGWAHQPIIALTVSYVLPMLLLPIALYLVGRWALRHGNEDAYLAVARRAGPFRAYLPGIAPMKGRRILRGLLAVLAAMAVLIPLSFMIPVQVWRTGELAAPPLPVVRGGPLVDLSRRVWVDTDAACGHAVDADADDCFALLVLLRAPEIEVAGISVVAGIASAAAAQEIVQSLVAQLPTTPSPPIYHGDAAREALQSALAKGPLTIVALGPLTNIAAGLRDRPDLVRNVTRLVAVMGRRPGHLFHPSEGNGNGMLFGHGPVFRDFNFDKDRDAAREVVALGLPTTLVPYEVARSLRLTAADLATLETAGGAEAWVARRAHGWLGFWADVVGLDGFYPFDALAAAYVVEPGLFDCAEVTLWIANDERLWGGWFGSRALLVGLASEQTDVPMASGTGYYCPRSSPQLRDWLMARFVEHQDVGDP